MTSKLAAWALVALLGWVSVVKADPPEGKAIEEAVKERPPIKTLRLHVVDDDGKPIAGARVTPWALGSSQDHEWWSENDKRAQVGPATTTTDVDGNTDVAWREFYLLKERIKTTIVSLQIDHPDFAYVDALHIDVPLPDAERRIVPLKRGVPIDVRPVLKDPALELKEIGYLWSDGRSTLSPSPLKPVEEGYLRIPGMGSGRNSVLAVRMDGDRATHFSRIMEFEIVPGQSRRFDTPLRPAVRIEGVIADVVPRPIKSGVVRLDTLPPRDGEWKRVSWTTWTSINPDGTFAIEGWPSDQRFQLIGLCDGFIVTPGGPPDIVKDAPNQAKDFVHRPRVYDASPATPIQVPMTPMKECRVIVVDKQMHPIAWLRVTAWPYVSWWNGGSQIYCHPLHKSEDLIRARLYTKVIREDEVSPFEGTSGADGRVTLWLPGSSQYLTTGSEKWELPSNDGPGQVQVELKPDGVTETQLVVQPFGTNRLGERERE